MQDAIISDFNYSANFKELPGVTEMANKRAK